jgi:hypothetical protein
MKHIILGVHITNRLKDAIEVQQVFTEFGAHIKTRLGLHEFETIEPSPKGLIILELVGAEPGCQALASRLAAIKGIEVQQMVFSHE